MVLGRPCHIQDTISAFLKLAKFKFCYHVFVGQNFVRFFFYTTIAYVYKNAFRKIIIIKTKHLLVSLFYSLFVLLQEIATLPERLLIVSNVPVSSSAVSEILELVKRFGAYKQALPLNGRVCTLDLNYIIVCTTLWLCKKLQN